MRNSVILAVSVCLVQSAASVRADDQLLQKHCSECHNDEKTKGKFNLKALGDGPIEGNAKLWIASLNNVEGLDMPPEDEGELFDPDRERLIEFLKGKITAAHEVATGPRALTPRRLNNRELIHSVAEVPIESA